MTEMVKQSGNTNFYINSCKLNAPQAAATNKLRDTGQLKLFLEFSCLFIFLVCVKYYV